MTLQRNHLLKESKRQLNGLPPLPNKSILSLISLRKLHNKAVKRVQGRKRIITRKEETSDPSRTETKTD